MRNKIGEIKARNAKKELVTLSIYQEYEAYVLEDNVGAKQYLPTTKSAETASGQPVNVDEANYKATIVQTGEILDIEEISYIV